jgi:S-adenosylmethionine:tRNA ribosyltransferase-isomerase
LHVGYGTFKPVLADDLADHRVDAEDYVVTEETAAALNAARAGGGRIVAAGTTATRVLETIYRDGVYRAGSGQTEVYIYPPRKLSAVDALQTNFHLPRSSLLALVCAFGGTEFILEAYRYAVEHEFRFYSYGDTMLIS